MNSKCQESNRRNRIKASTSESRQVLAREKSRCKPEDIAKSRFLFGVGTAVVSFFKCLAGFFHFRSRKYRPINYASSFFGRPSKKDHLPKWFFSLRLRHYGEIGLSYRSTRRWCKTGYFSKPRAEHFKKHPNTKSIEVLGKTSKAHWQKPKAVRI